MVEFGFVTDEIAPELDEALRVGLSWGARLYELRCAGGRRVPFLDKADAALLRAILKNKDARITALSPGLFKRPIAQTVEIERELTDLLPRTLELAQELAAPLVIVFGFMREPQCEPSPERAVEHMRRAGDMAAGAGIRLAVENEPGYLCDSGSATADFLRRVDHEAVRANWDPANAVGSGELPFPDGYNAILPYIANVHAKDTRDGALVRCLPIGQGAVNWSGQLRSIVEDGIVGHVTIETHCEPLMEMSRRNLGTLRDMLPAALREK